MHAQYFRSKEKNISVIEKQMKKINLQRQEILMRLSIKESEIKNINERRNEKIKEYKKEIDLIQEENMSDLYKSIVHRKKSGVII